MKILSFEMRDADGWTLEPMKLDAFNLLVGLSGAGKTRIVRAIQRVCALALGTKETYLESLWHSRFALDFEHEGVAYRWEAERDFDDHTSLIRGERITAGDRLLVERTPERFVFDGRDLPRLDRAKSAIATLKEDPAMAPLHVAFSRCVFTALETEPAYSLNSKDDFEEQRARYGSVHDVGADFSLAIHHKAELLAYLFRDSFAQIEEAFRDAFPLVEKLEVERVALGGLDQPWSSKYPAFLSATESGIAHPITFAAMSSGMQRYLSFLIHLSFAPRGTVVLIDELDASLGINCLPAATDFLLGRAPDLQLILTSHHPYIIQKIPTDLWKIVTRKGNHVRVLDAASIPDLEESRSHLDRFTRLINQPEYAQGIQA